LCDDSGDHQGEAGKRGQETADSAGGMTSSGTSRSADGGPDPGPLRPVPVRACQDAFALHLTGPWRRIPALLGAIGGQTATSRPLPAGSAQRSIPNNRTVPAIDPMSTGGIFSVPGVQSSWGLQNPRTLPTKTRP
jgi:hypothetical protein